MYALLQLLVKKQSESTSKNKLFAGFDAEPDSGEEDGLVEVKESKESLEQSQ